MRGAWDGGGGRCAALPRGAPCRGGPGTEPGEAETSPVACGSVGQAFGRWYCASEAGTRGGVELALREEASPCRGSSVAALLWTSQLSWAEAASSVLWARYKATACLWLWYLSEEYKQVAWWLACARGPGSLGAVRALQPAAGTRCWCKLLPVHLGSVALCTRDATSEVVWA